jgi:hypothetical protein
MVGLPKKKLGMFNDHHAIRGRRMELSVQSFELHTGSGSTSKAGVRPSAASDQEKNMTQPCPS